MDYLRGSGRAADQASLFVETVGQGQLLQAKSSERWGTAALSGPAEKELPINKGNKQEAQPKDMSAADGATALHEDRLLLVGLGRRLL